jgi:hypothetical protein
MSLFSLLLRASAAAKTNKRFPIKGLSGESTAVDKDFHRALRKPRKTRFSPLSGRPGCKTI